MNSNYTKVLLTVFPFWTVTCLLLAAHLGGWYLVLCVLLVMIPVNFTEDLFPLFIGTILSCIAQYMMHGMSMPIGLTYYLGIVLISSVTMYFMYEDNINR